ncbi:MAG: hypothetical protein DRP91_00220 [Candidatus Neomarinimicrobiota bacterium]|nr:MAG: hypothetical protein DRP91_00220 [Candidatus Neomarinimicrobiota bacterium]
MSGYGKTLRIILSLFLILFLFLPGRSNAGIKTSPIEDYLHHYLSSLKTIGDLNYHKKTYLAAAGLLPISFLFDAKLQKYISQNPVYPKPVSKLGDLYGNPYGYLITSLLIFSEGVIFRQKFNKTVCKFVLLAETILTTATVTSLLKDITHRQRPNKESYSSFPSGHTSGSFALAAVVDKLYGKKAGIFAYSMAVFVGTTRINDNKHYLSDVIAGSILGTVIGRSFAKNFNENMIKVIWKPKEGEISLVYEF